MYKIFKILQRCWAHLLREVDEFADESGGKELSEAIHGKFRLLRAFLDKDPPASMDERKIEWVNDGRTPHREHVLIEKIIGTFRSTKGAEYYQYIASLFATWRLQKKDIFEELDGLLRKELCGVR